MEKKVSIIFFSYVIHSEIFLHKLKHGLQNSGLKNYLSDFST